VAAELAQIAAEAVKTCGGSTGNDDHLLYDEVIATLREAHKRGLPSGIDLATDERFGSLASDERYRELVNRLSRPSDKGDEASAESNVSTTENNMR
jgi:hypothetical protein